MVAIVTKEGEREGEVEFSGTVSMLDIMRCVLEKTSVGKLHTLVEEDEEVGCYSMVAT